MQMKVHNKGQVVIPAAIRKELGIVIGDELDVEIDLRREGIILKKHSGNTSSKLAGSLRQYKKGRCFPSRREMHERLRHGLAGNA